MTFSLPAIWTGPSHHPPSTDNLFKWLYVPNVTTYEFKSNEDEPMHVKKKEMISTDEI